MKKSIVIALATILAGFTACNKDYAPPTLTIPATQDVEVSTSVDLVFNFVADAGFNIANASATNGSASITTNGSKGDVSGAITVSYTAGTSAGAGSVTLNLVDSEDQEVSATAVLSVFEEGAPEVTAPTTSEVEVLDMVDITFSFTSEGGYASSAITAVKGSAVVKTDASAGTNSGSVVVTFTAGRSTGAGSVEITMTDVNGKSGVATAVVDVQGVPTISVSENISADATWTADNVYILEGRIAVLDQATLTIEAGTVIKGNAGSGSNACALLIARGGKLNANGTAQAPIIFTSIADQILPGEIESPNLQSTENGYWGGLIVLGKAPISADAEAVQIEGIPPSDLNGLYGGSDPLDNSGSITYISIRHGGANIGEGNEINGLTLGGVGSGTTIQNIEIIANQDDGIEWFGGTVNVTNALVWNTGDDAIDTDQSWGGTLDNAIIVNPGDECFELDGAEGTMLAKHYINNVTAYAGDAEGLVDLDPNSNVDMDNIYFFGLKAGQDFDELPEAQYNCVFTDFEATLPAGSVLVDFFKGDSDLFTSAVATGQNTVGADKAAFSGWTWAAVSGALDNF